MALQKSSATTLVALIIGIGAAVFAGSWMKTRLEAAAAAQAGTTPVVVAARDIPFGERIEADAVRTVAWPNGSLPEESFSDVNDVVGRYTNQPLWPGEAVLKARVVPETSGNRLSTLIQPNNRAVTVRVNDVIGVAGFLLPGNRVDVLATRVERNGTNEHARTVTLLQNLKVLAVDQTAEPKKGEPVVVRAVTLEMSPEQAEMLVAATEEGTVQLALRNPEDRDLTVAAAEPPPVVAPPPPVVQKPVVRKARVTRKAAEPSPVPNTATITIIRQAQTAEMQTMN